MGFLEQLIEDTCKSKHQYSSIFALGQSKKAFRLKDLVIRKHEKMPLADQHLINFSKYEAILVCQNMNILQLFFFFRERLIS